MQHSRTSLRLGFSLVLISFILVGWFTLLNQHADALVSQVESPATSTQYQIYIPYMVSSESLPGLDYQPPQQWLRAIGDHDLSADTANLTASRFVQYTSPEDNYRLQIVSDWHLTAPEAAFGTYALPPLDNYTIATDVLPTGQSVQIVEMESSTDLSGSTLLAHAAFRDGDFSYAVRLYGTVYTDMALLPFYDLLDTLRPHGTGMMFNNNSSMVNAGPGPQFQLPATTSYDRGAAVQYAHLWTVVNPLMNSDGCYLWFNGSDLRCTHVHSSYWGVDGAHFINMALRAGGIDVPPLWANEAIQIQALRSWLLNNGVGQQVASASDLVPGDVIFVGTNSCWGWGGVVVAVDSQGPLLHVHSRISNNITTDWAYARHTQMSFNNCGATNNYSFMRISATQDEPGPLVSTSLMLSPSTPAAGNTVEATFQVCNYGGSDFSTDQLYVSVDNPGTNFPIVNPPTLASGDPGGCYEYTQSGIPFPSSGTYGIRAGYIDDSGSFRTLGTVAGEVNEQTVTVVSETDIQIEGTVTVNPQTVAQGETATVLFTARNVGAAAITNQFRIHVYDEEGNLVTQFPATDSITIEPGGSFTYDESLTFDIPGIYWVVANHNFITGEWRPVYGDSRALVRVTYPMPSPAKLAKGMPDYIALAGEPVNTGSGNFVHRHIDLSIPLPGLSFDITRFYNHIDADEVSGDFGPGWTWTLGQRIAWRDDMTAVMTYPDGQEAYFFGEWDIDDPFNLSGAYVGKFADANTIYRYEDGTAVYTDTQQLRYEFSAAGWLTAVSDSAGNGFSIERSQTGQVEQLQHTGGQTYLFTYNNDTISAIAVPGDYILTYEYDTQGNLVQATKAAGDTISYEYDDRHRIITITDALNQTFLVNEYDDDNRVWRQTDAAGVQTTFAYPSEDTTVFTDEMGHETTYTYDDLMRVIRIEDARGAVTTYDYDDAFNRIEEIDPEGGIWRWAYDEQGRVISETNPIGATWLYRYDERGNLVEQLDPLGEATLFEYDEQNNRIKVIDAERGETRFEYDDQGQVITKIDPIGATITYEYGPLGLPVRIVDELGGVITIEYDQLGNRTRYTDAAGRTTTSNYDEAGRMVSTTGPLGNTIEFTHDDNGNLLSETDGAGHARFYVYDEQDRLVEQSDYRGNVWQFEYDALWRLAREEDPLEGVVTYVYDEVGNILSRTNERGATWHYEYDHNNNEIAVIDPLGHTTHKAYDAANRLVRIERPCDTCDGGLAVETFTYDLADRMTAFTDGRNHTTHYAYDRVGRLVSEADALGHTTAYAYNERGDLITIIDQHGEQTSMAYNAAGWLITETNRLGDQTVRAYDAVGNMVSFQDARGFTTFYEYDVADRLIIETDALGNVTTYNYDVRGNLVSLTDALGRTTLFDYDADNNLTAVTNPRGHTTQYEYDALGREVKQINAVDGEFVTTYDPMGAILTETDQAGHSHTYTYDPMGRVLTFTDSNGHTTSYAYDSQGNRITTTDPLDNITRRTYDANSNLISHTNALGHTTRYEYDALNRQVTVIDALDGISRRVYDEVGRLVEEIDANGHATRFVYDAEGRRLAKIDALDQTTSYEYDASGNLVRLVDRNGHETLTTYDGLNRPVSSTNGLGYTESVVYDAVGNRVAETNFRGYTTQYEYDANDNLVGRIDALSGETLFVYDELDRATAVTDANGHTTTTTYDAVGNVVAITLPEGQTTAFTYDGEGNRLTLTNAKGYTTTTSYDALNRPISQRDPLEHLTRMEYDAIGQLVAEIDALENSNRFGYDPLGRLITVTDALSHTATYLYDPVGNLLAETNANGQTTQYGYDPLNRLITETNPMGDSWSYSYDAEGNMIEQIDANGLQTDYTFDAENQLTGIVYEDGTAPVTLAYDPNGNLTTMVDGVGTTMLAYDPLDREIAKVDPYGRSTFNAYDAVGNRIGLTYPSGNTVTYHYNANDWMVEAVDANEGVTAYEYDPDGLVTLTTFPNNTWTEQVFDAANRLVQLYNGTPYQHQVITAYAYTLDAVGNRVEVIEQYTQGQVRTNVKTYEYNARYELISAVEEYEGPPAYTVTTLYEYDPAGNRVSMTTNRFPGTGQQPPLETTTYTYDNAGRMLSAGDTIYTYDANGNRISKLTPESPPSQTRLETYAYDAENRLTLYERSRVQNGQVEQRVYNEYDGLGRRVNKGLQQGSGTIKWIEYVVDSLGYDQLAEYPQTGSPIVTELYRGLDNELISMDELQGGGQGTQYWFATDGLGSVAATTKQNGQSTHEVFYDPFGLIIDNNGHWQDASSWTDPHLHYLLSGKEWDEESRLYYFGARYYDAEAGIWLTADPYRGQINSPMTRHRYLYVRNNPINRIDPLGYFEWSTGRVQWGDTWQSVAVQWGTSVDELKRLNPWVKEPRVGDYLQLPECRSAQCQMRLGINEVRINGVSGAVCGQRIVQQQREYQAWLAEQRRLAEVRRQTEVAQREHMEWQREFVRRGLLPQGCGTTMSCEIPTGCGVNMSCAPSSVDNQRLGFYDYLFFQENYLNDGGLLLDSLETIVTNSWQAYWEYYPRMSSNRVTIIRQKPNLTIYSRTKVGVNAKSESMLAYSQPMSVQGTFIQSPHWKSTATPFALLGVGLSGYGQYQEDIDRHDLDVWQRTGRISLTVGASSLVAAGAVGVAATIGAPVIVGVAAGAAIGVGGQWLWNRYKEDVFDAFEFN